MASRRHSPVSLQGFVICGAEHSLLSPTGRVTSRALLVGMFFEFGILLYRILFHFSIHSTHFHANSRSRGLFRAPARSIVPILYMVRGKGKAPLFPRVLTVCLLKRYAILFWPLSDTHMCRKSSCYGEHLIKQILHGSGLLIGSVKSSHRLLPLTREGQAFRVRGHFHTGS